MISALSSSPPPSQFLPASLHVPPPAGHSLLISSTPLTCSPQLQTSTHQSGIYTSLHHALIARLFYVIRASLASISRTDSPVIDPACPRPVRSVSAPVVDPAFRPRQWTLPASPPVAPSPSGSHSVSAPCSPTKQVCSTVFALSCPLIKVITDCRPA